MIVFVNVSIDEELTRVEIPEKTRWIPRNSRSFNIFVYLSHERIQLHCYGLINMIINRYICAQFQYSFDMLKLVELIGCIIASHAIDFIRRKICKN